MHAAHDKMVAAVGRGHVTHDLGDRADMVELIGPRDMGGRIALEEYADGLAVLGRGLRAGHGLGTAYHQGRDDAREQHRIAGRQHNDGIVRQIGMRRGYLRRFPLCFRLRGLIADLRAFCLQALLLVVHAVHFCDCVSRPF